MAAVLTPGTMFFLFNPGSLPTRGRKQNLDDSPKLGSDEIVASLFFQVWLARNQSFEERCSFEWQLLDAHVVSIASAALGLLVSDV